MGTIVSLLNVQGGRGRSEEKSDWKRVGANFDGGWGSSARGWNITEFDIVSRLDGGSNNLTGTTTVTAVTTGTTTITASSASTAITASTASTTTVS